MPDCLLTFFAALFKIPKSKLFKQSIGDLNNLFKPPEGDDDDAHEVYLKVVEPIYTMMRKLIAIQMKTMEPTEVVMTRSTFER